MLDFRGRGVNVADWRLRPRHPPRATFPYGPGSSSVSGSKVPWDPRSGERGSEMHCRESAKTARSSGRSVEVQRPPHSHPGGSSRSFAPSRAGILLFWANSASSNAFAVLHACSEMFHDVRANNKVEQMDRENVPKRSAPFPDVPKCSQNAVFAERTHRKRKRANRSSPSGRSFGCSFVETNPPPLYISSACTSSG